MHDTNEAVLIEKLRKVEALFARAATPGERIAAEHALERLSARLRDLERQQPPKEHRFSFPDSWSRALFTALLRRYGIKPFRYTGQRRTTVMARVTPAFLNETLWPEFEQFNRLLHEHLHTVTDRIISQAIDQKDAEVEVRAEPTSAPGGEPRHVTLEP